MIQSSSWKTGADHVDQEARRYSSLLWWVLCSYQLRLSWLGYRGHWKHMQRLQNRVMWDVLMPEYGRERVTWWHVFGARRFSTPLPPEIGGVEMKIFSGIKCHRFWWNEA